MDVDLGPVPLALAAAVCFAGSHVTARRGLVESSVVSAVLISCSSALLVLGAAVAFDPPTAIVGKGFLLFALAGLAAPGVSRWAASTGVHRLGPSVAVPITQGTRPLIAVMGAVLILGEQVTISRLIGIGFIIGGGWELSRSRREARSLGLGALEGPLKEDAQTTRFFRVGVIFPVLAGMAYATQDVVVKEALQHYSHPQFGAMVGMGTALAIWGLAVLVIPGLRAQVRVGRDFGWLCVSGSLAGIAILALFHALELGEVSLVSPITASQPLIVFVLSPLLLGRLEHVHISTVISGFAVVAGTILVSL